MKRIHSLFIKARPASKQPLSSRSVYHTSTSILHSNLLLDLERVVYPCETQDGNYFISVSNFLLQ
jgi:hypothetical protein